jgi:hypothetical protein
MPGGLRRIAWLCAIVLSVAGCTTMHTAGKSPLTRPQMSPDSVVLEIFFVRFPLGQQDAHGPLWGQVDEQQIANETRRQLLQNGFRVGLVSGQVPPPLERLMELKDKPAPGKTTASQVKLNEMDAEPRVVRRHLQLRAGQRSEIIASDIRERMSVLTCEDGKVCGSTYPQAQGILAIKAFPEAGGQTRIEVTPEVHYGEPKQRYVGDAGAMRLEASRSHRVFDKMTISATLAPGYMLVARCLDDRPGTLGQQFLTSDDSGRRDQRLLLIRLSQTQQDDLYDSDQVLRLE